MRSVLYMPDGNRRFAKKRNLSLSEAYYLGGKTLRLFSEFFVAEKKADTLIYHVTSLYNHNRTDSSLEAIYKACIKTSEDLIKEKFFENNGISFKAIDHSGKLPKRLDELVKELSESTKNRTKGEFIILLGYSLKKDYNQALAQKPGDYELFKKKLIFSDIDLVIRTTEMRISNGPIYAMEQAQMMILDKFNPEVKKEDLEKLWKDYMELKSKRK